MAEHGELSVWLVQIERFLRRESYLDAIARAKRLVEEAEKLLAADPSDREAAQLLALGKDRLRVATQAFEEKNRAVAERRLRAMRSLSEG